MRRTDDVYWQRLRRDKRSGFATVLTAFAFLPPTIGISMLVAPGSHTEARANPLYWLAMVPLVWFAVGLTTYAPKYVRLLKPALLAAPPFALAVAIVATRMGQFMPPFWIATAVSTVASLLGWFLYHGSMLEREGPAR